MNKIYFISDTHFDHINIIKYCDRPFKDVEEMNEVIMNNWNKTIDNNDIVYFLGDFCLNNRHRIAEILNQLNGYKILVYGNHDKIGVSAFKTAGFDEVYKTPIKFTYNNDIYILSHAPDYETSLKNIHGHIHNINKNDNRHFCVSVEQINYTPIEIEKIVEYFKEV